jgi:SAM-dependent methyltransferase
MGTSNWQNISYNIDIIRKLNPKSVLDIGVGFGRWGILCREFLEIWDGGKYSGVWNRKIDGVEIFRDYIKDYHYNFYNNIYITDAYDFISVHKEKYDLIIFGDVIEHFEKKVGEEIIDICFEKSKFVLINLPIGKFWEQGKKNDNPFEEHKSIWVTEDFRRFENKKIRIFRDIFHRKFAVILLSKFKFKLEAENRKKYGRYYKIKGILRHILHGELFLQLYNRYKKNDTKFGD